MQNPLVINPKQEVERITEFLKKTFREQKINKVVLGFSGGIDSAVALYLLKRVLPPKNIYVVQMDYYPRKKPNIDLKGINVINISIKKIVDQFGPVSKIRLGNIMARVRMIILFDFAKQLNTLVCGTENKSEKLLGYFTRFGDAASDLEPISHLYKTQVYQLAKYLNISNEIINQSPTAGLWNGQTDEDDFGFTYEEADKVLYLSHDCEQDINIIKREFPNAEKIIKRYKDNQFKQAAPYSLK
ncbi:MAG: NAD(+) synthase [Patescibacteria group bacterium]|jgi:NAD+ synthase